MGFWGDLLWRSHRPRFFDLLVNGLHQSWSGSDEDVIDVGHQEAIDLTIIQVVRVEQLPLVWLRVELHQLAIVLPLDVEMVSSLVMPHKRGDLLSP